jgi:hypothetical protein
MKKTIFLLGIILLLSSFKTDTAIEIPSGEKLVYAGSYNMSGLMTQLAQVTLSTEMVNTSNKSYLHLNCELATFAKWDKFFKIRDTYEAYVNPTTLKPSLYKRNIEEGGWTKKEKYVFKGNSVTSTSKRKNCPETTKTFTIGNSTQDVVSLMYKLRTLAFDKMKVGQSQSFVIVFDEVQVPVTINKLSIGAKTDVLKGKDKNLIYLTADSKKIPALMKFSIPVGTGQLALTSATGI